MLQQGIRITRDSAYYLLQECAKKKDLECGKWVHFMVVQNGFDSLAVFGDHLIEFYSYHGHLVEANQIFNTITSPTACSWEAILSGNANLGQCKVAIELHRQMLLSGLNSDKHTYLPVLKACTVKKYLMHGIMTHDHVINCGLQSDTALGNTLVEMYANCGQLETAYKLFDKFESKDITSWNLVISGSLQHGNSGTALFLFNAMQQEGIEPNEVAFLSAVKACTNIGALNEGMIIHESIMKSGLLSDCVVGCSLIDMYLKHGNLKEAEKLVNKLPRRDLLLWNKMIGQYLEHNEFFLALNCLYLMQKEGVEPNLTSWSLIILGCIKHDEGALALNLFELNQHKGIKPNKAIFLSALKACIRIGKIEHGRLIHESIMSTVQQIDHVLGNTLVDMYCKIDCLEEGCNVFHNLTNRTVVSWTAMLTGYVQQGENVSALEFFGKMQQDGIVPNEVTLSSAAKACCSIGAITNGRLIHEQVITNGNQKDIILWNILIDMYAQCMSFMEACRVFDKLSGKNVASFNTMIVACLQHGAYVMAFDCLEQMRERSIAPNHVTFLGILRACNNANAIAHGRRLHEMIIGDEVKSEHLRNTLLDMYAKCGSLEEAHNEFDKMPNRSVVSWNTLISGYVQNEESLLALDQFRNMQKANIVPNDVTYLAVVKACGSLGALHQGRVIHEQVIESDHKVEVELGNTLVHMYASCGATEEARKVFDNFPNQSHGIPLSQGCTERVPTKLRLANVVSWNAMIAGYICRGEDLLALEWFSLMREHYIEPNKVTFSSVLKACVKAGAVEQAKLIHVVLMKQGLLTDVNVGNSLINMYIKHGHLKEAYKIYNVMPSTDMISWGILFSGYVQDGTSIQALQCFKMFVQESIKPSVVSWNALIAGYTKSGEVSLALNCFDRMRKEGVKPNEVTLVCVLKACAEAGALKQGRLIQEMMKNEGLYSHVILGNMLVHMYAKCGCLEEASEVFCQLPSRDAVSWDSIITGYAKNAKSFLALELSEKMQMDDIDPNEVTFLSAIKACTNLGALEQGRLMHEWVMEYAMQVDNVLASALVNMYAKCGSLEESCRVFSEISNRNVVSWNIMIMSYANHGKGSLALDCLEWMQQEGVPPNETSFTGIFIACSRAGLLDKGCCYYQSMSESYGITTNVFHCACMIDLLGRAGCLDEADDLLEVVVQTNMVGSRVLLSAYSMCGDVKAGEHWFDKIVHLDTFNSDVNMSILLLD